MLTVRIAPGCGPTGQLLQQELRDANNRNQGVVCWGTSYTGSLPVLNARAGTRSKYNELAELRAAGVRVPRTWLSSQWNNNLPRPILARRFNHKGGRDIRLVRTLRGLQVWSRKRDFFSELIGSTTEYRVFVFRRLHLATYEKVMRHPEMNRYFGRNSRNGYAFDLRTGDNIPRGAVEAAKAAVDALGLDFGAVDILRGRDGNFYVLEVNTAPGAEGNNRQWFSSLVNHIKTWERNGFLRRNGEER